MRLRARHAPAAALAVMAVLLLAACGGTTVVREPPVVVEDQPPAPGKSPRGDAVRIAVVTHGQASSPFWATVRNGVEAAARQMDVVVQYRAPDIYSLQRMKELVDQAVASRPDGLVVSLPEPALGPAIRRAVRAGIATVTINSGSEQAKRLGVLAHVGQPEDRAGLRAGERLVAAGVRRALCVNQQVGNLGLDARCRGLARAMRAAGGFARVLGVDDQDPATPRRITEAVRRFGVDGVLSLNSTSAGQAIQAVQGLRGVLRAGAVKVATFDLGPEVLEAVRQGRLLFAVDQQPYLQGYLPVVMLAQQARFGLFPARGEVIPTGPSFVTRAEAGKALELSRRSIR
jgi:simple sugar transport system substrate-binding protein